MSGNGKQRTTLTNLNEPQQMRELNRQLTWIWDQLLGGLGLKSLSSGARKVIDSKASSEDVDALGNVVSENSTSIVQTAEKIEATATKVQTLDDRVTENESQILQTPEQIRLAVQSVEIGGRNLLTKTKTLENASSDLALWQTVSAHSRAEDEDGFCRIDWKAAGLTADQTSVLKSPLFKLPDGWFGRKAALSFWVKAEDWETLDGGMEARICLTTGDRAEDYRWVRLKMLDAGGAAGEDLGSKRPVNGQWRRVWALAELTQEELRGSGTVELPKPSKEEKPVYEPVGDEKFGILKQPEDVTVREGETVVLRIEAAGAAGYQWQNSQDGVNWSNSGLDGYNTDTLTFPMLAMRYLYLWRCVITDAAGKKLASRGAKLIRPCPITKQPESVDAEIGETVHFTVTADGTYKYQWQNSQDGVTWADSGVDGYNTGTLNVPVIAVRYNYLWRCVLTDSLNLTYVSEPVMIRKPLNAVTHGWAGVYVKRNADFSLKAPQLEFGDRPSDWSPAPEDVDGELTKIQSELVVQADEIALRVKQETLDAAIDGVQVGGTNLLCVSDVTVNNGGACIERPRAYYCRSGKAIKFNPLPAGGQINISQLKAVNLRKGVHAVSFNAWSEGVDETGEIIIRFNLYDGENGYDEIKFSATLDEKYQRFKGTFELGGNLFAYPRFLIGTASTFTTGNVYITDWKLEEGNRATDWTPAPEEVELEVKKLEAELSVQAGKISANTTKIETVDQSAAAAQSKADANAADLTAVTKRVTTAEASISALDGEISSKVSKTDFNALGNRVSSAESTITQQDGKISAKVEKSEFDELGNIVSQQGTKIEQTDEQVLILAGQRIGGTNLIRIGTDEQISLTAGSISRGTTNYYRQGGVLFSMSAHSGTNNILTFKEGVKVRPGNYMLSFWCWTYGIDVQPTVRCNLLNMDLTRDHYFKDIQPTANTPVRYEIPVEVTYTDTMRLRFVVPTKWTAGNLFFSDVKLEEGDKATTWSPCPDDPAGSVNAGGVVRVDSTGVHLSGGVVEMETSDGDEFIHITNSGISASSLEAPNVARRYAGKTAIIVRPDATSAQIAGGGYFRSLPEACAALSGRYLDKNVTITVSGTTYGDAYLRGVTGFGSVTVTGGGNILYGSLSLLDNTAEIWVNGLKIVRSGSAYAFAGRQYGTGWARWYQCVLDGNGGDQGFLTDRGARAMIWSCELYNAAKLLQVSHNANVSCIGLKGGGGTNFLHGDGGLVTWSGTRPDGVLSIANPCLREPYDLAALPIDYGTAQPSVPVVQTAAYSYLYSDSHVGGWGYFDNDDIYQGFVRTSDAGDTAAAYGVIWFDQAKIKAALNGKTINQASLRLHMHTGVGRGSAVSVQLYGTNTAYAGRSGAPALTASYGDIGSTNPGETAEITIPAQAVLDLVSGTICALVLKSSDAELYKDRDYSRNYARFSGTGSATAENCPRLTVVYQ